MNNKLFRLSLITDKESMVQCKFFTIVNGMNKIVITDLSSVQVGIHDIFLISSKHDIKNCKSYKFYLMNVSYYL